MDWTGVEQAARSPIPLPGRGTSGDRGWDAQASTSAPMRTVAPMLRAAGRFAQGRVMAACLVAA
jgi:hypothetical protein